MGALTVYDADVSVDPADAAIVPGEGRFRRNCRVSAGAVTVCDRRVSLLSGSGDSMGILDGKIAVVTGSGHGIGRGEALELAAQGAKVVVNDLGGTSSGEGADKRPADEVVEVIKARGGEAVANYDDVADFGGAENMIATAYDAFGGLDILVNNAGHHPGQDDRVDERGRLRLGPPGAPQGHVRRDASSPASAGASAPRRASPSGRPSSTRSRRRGCRATSARPTTARPRPGSPPSRSSPRSRGPASGSGPTRSPPAASPASPAAS